MTGMQLRVVVHAGDRKGKAYKFDPNAAPAAQMQEETSRCRGVCVVRGFALVGGCGWGRGWDSPAEKPLQKSVYVS